MGGLDWTRRYLNLLGFGLDAGSPFPAPDAATLRRVTRAQVLSVPFESITPVLRRRTWHAETVRTRHFGNARRLDRQAVRACAGDRDGQWLLVSLGYQPAVPGQISTGSPSVMRARRQTAIWSTLATVHRSSIQFRSTTFGSPHGLAYRFRPDPESDATVRDAGSTASGNRFATRAHVRTAARNRYQQHHLVGCSWVVDSIVVVRCTDDQVSSMRDGQLTRFTADGKTRPTFRRPGHRLPRYAAGI
jgi:hypothetical protein